jgi:RNA polymerase sigma factor (sigma-70 family)
MGAIEEESQQSLDYLHHKLNESIVEIMNVYGDEIKRLVYSYVKNEADAEDVTQEVFVTVYQKLHTYQGDSSLKSWIYSIAINKSKDNLRSWHSRNQKLLYKIQNSGNLFTASKDTPEKETVKRDESDILFEKIMELPVKYREVIILFYYKELTLKEISNILGQRQPTIHTRLFRARKKLKDLLLDEKGGYTWINT